MRFNFLRSWPVSAKIFLGMSLWLGLISYAHYQLNLEHNERMVVNMGYMPVITNLAAPLLDRASQADEQLVRFKAMKFSSFAEMAEALRNNKIQAAFMIAPLAIVLQQQKEAVKVIYIGNRHESTLVARKSLNIQQFSDLEGKTIAVPIRYSGHNLSLLKLLEQHHLTDKIHIVEMNPPDMAAALVAGSLDAYYVGEPFAAKTLKAGHASLVHYVETVWPNFVCNLMVVRQDFIQAHPKIVQQLVTGAARAGLWAERHTAEVVQIASQYWNQPPELVQYALTTPPHRIRYDQFIPKSAEMQEFADLMVHFQLAKSANIEGLVEDRFAKAAPLDHITDDLNSILVTP